MVSASIVRHTFYFKNGSAKQMMHYFVNTIREHDLCDKHKDCRAAHDSFNDYFSEDETEAESDLEDLSSDDDQLFCNCPNPPRNIIKQHYLH